jgi:hypothetical protein
LPESPTGVQRESDHVAAAANIKYVYVVSVLGNCVRFGAAGENLIHQRKA